MPSGLESSGSGRPTLLAVCTLPPWPVQDGYSLRVAHLLGELAPSWRITLLAPAAPDIPPGIAEHVPLTLHGRGLTYPWRFDQTELRAAIDRVTRGRRFDRALVWAGAEAVWFDRPDLPPGVVDVIDCNPLEFARGFLRYRDLRQRYRALREIPVATRYARRTVQCFSATVCVGEADARWLRRVGGRSSVHVVPNGVDIPALETIAPKSDTPTLCFTGTLDYQPNIEAVRHAVGAIWPRISAAIPAARFVIAGRNPTPEIRALGARPGIAIAADVPDMLPVLGAAWVAIAPMRSGVGIKNKVLEAWASARPVVLTPLATNGLIIPPDHTKLVCNSADAMADAVIRLLDDPTERARLGQSARATVQQHFTWSGIASRIDALLREAGR